MSTLLSTLLLVVLGIAGVLLAVRFAYSLGRRDEARDALREFESLESRRSRR